jgi:putative ABC transport system substrate-binding protein
MVGAIEPEEQLRQLRQLANRQVQAGLLTWSDADPGVAAREALAARLPLVGANEAFTEAGLLASYAAVDLAPAPKLAAAVEQILRGADPATIPFQFPQLFRLVINRRTANALRLVVPPDLLLRADRVIE